MVSRSKLLSGNQAGNIHFDLPFFRSRAFENQSRNRELSPGLPEIYFQVYPRFIFRFTRDLFSGLPEIDFQVYPRSIFRFTRDLFSGLPENGLPYYTLITGIMSQRYAHKHLLVYYDAESGPATKQQRQLRSQKNAIVVLKIIGISVIGRRKSRHKKLSTATQRMAIDRLASHRS